MATLTINNISDDLLKKLERSALERGLSVEDEAIRRILSTSFPLNEREREALMQRIRENRRKLAEEGIWTTDEEVNRFKREGRLGEAATEPIDWIEIARKHRESMPDFSIDDEEQLNRFKREGRL